MDLRAKFLKTYANLPLPLRNEIILSIDGEPITWNVARIEISEDTEKGKRILDLLLKLDIIKNNE